MTTRYTMINGKEYVSLRRYQNMQGKYETQKAKCDELEKENKELKNEIGECHGLMDEIDFWKREAKMLGGKQKHIKKEDIIILVFIAIMLLFTAYLTKLRFNL